MKLLLLVNILFVSLIGKSNRLTPTLSNEAEIYLITCGEGPEIWSHFGHTGIRVFDPKNNINVVFNYGMFQFGEGFIWQFAKGKLNYFVSAENADSFKNFYTQNNRELWQQKFNLSQEKKNEFYQALVLNIKEENKYYLYDFFFKNCATQPRDILYNILRDDLELASHTDVGKVTFRDLVKQGYKNDPWLLLGINLVLGSKLEKQPTANELMFSPLYMSEILAESKIKSTGEKLLGPIEFVNKKGHSKNIDLSVSKAITPTLVFWIIFGIAGVLSLLNFKKWHLIFDITLFTAVGILGVLLIFMVFFTDHFTASPNFNLLWANPLWIALPIFLVKKLRQKYNRVFQIYGGYILFLAVAWFILPQELPTAIRPIMLALGIRSLSIYKATLLKVF